MTAMKINKHAQTAATYKKRYIEVTGQAGCIYKQSNNIRVIMLPIYESSCFTELAVSAFISYLPIIQVHKNLFIWCLEGELAHKNLAITNLPIPVLHTVYTHIRGEKNFVLKVDRGRFICRS